MVKEVLNQDERLYSVMFERVKSWTDKDTEHTYIEKFYLARSFADLLQLVADDLPTYTKSITFNLLSFGTYRIVDDD